MKAFAAFRALEGSRSTGFQFGPKAVFIREDSMMEFSNKQGITNSSYSGD